MKKRLMLPAMAFVFAIGLSFATEKSTVDPNNDWVDMGLPDRVKIQEVNCGVQQQEDCKGIFEEGGLEYEVYDTETSTAPKQGAGDLVKYLTLAN